MNNVLNKVVRKWYETPVDRRPRECLNSRSYIALCYPYQLDPTDTTGIGLFPQDRANGKVERYREAFLKTPLNYLNRLVDDDNSNGSRRLLTSESI